MKKIPVKLGVAATRRNVFSSTEAVNFKNRILRDLRENDVEVVDLEWLNEEGLLYQTADVPAVQARFLHEGVDALFIPHCNFGCEAAVCQLSRALGVPVLLWGPRDDAPQPDGLRLRDSQCGLFATSAVLRNMGVPFTYLENSWIDHPEWLEGVKRFLCTALTVKRFRHLRIGQVDTRPGDFWSVMCNEAELLRRFGIETVPLTLVDIRDEINRLLTDSRSLLENQMQQIRHRFRCDFPDNSLEKLAALKITLAEWAQRDNLSAIAVQCWNAMQSLLGIMPCAVNAMLTDEGLPVVCETDICGAVSAVLAQAAAGDTEPVFFADVTVRHPSNDNAELLWHCGNFPPSLRREGEPAVISSHYTLPDACPGVCEWELRHDTVTILRFGGSNGRYSLLAAKGNGVDGPKSRGTYLWTEFADWPALERRLIYGPYIHHVAGIYGDIIPIIKEALRYMPGVEDDIVHGCTGGA